MHDLANVKPFGTIGRRNPPHFTSRFLPQSLQFRLGRNRGFGSRGQSRYLEIKNSMMNRDIGLDSRGLNRGRGLDSRGQSRYVNIKTDRRNNESMDVQASE